MSAAAARLPDSPAAPPRPRTRPARRDAEDRLEALRWPRRGPVCPHCGSRHAYRMVCVRSGGVRFKCARCRKPFSARRGTVMERSNVDTATWLRVMALYLDDSGRGLPVRVQKLCGVSYKTAWSMVRRLDAAPDDPVLAALRRERGSAPAPAPGCASRPFHHRLP
ncbi:transposase [Roseospira goensis]|uniref:Transposase-like protein n=1 Tax=Roseospira goensis TaxID=391922 RepID=A0A7W6RZ47_9PROT|nr:transposase [Roseospira goensis]MBB4285921.1 transposase-like protein [Roseospira goensis]